MISSRTHSGYFAFALHRISGLALAMFLPIHFYMLSLLLKDPERLDVFLSWTATPAVKFTESILILLAAAHLAGGLRIIAYEFVTHRAGRRVLVFTATAFASACALGFLWASSS